MSLADLTLDRWRSFDLTAAQRFAAQAAAQVDGRVTLVEPVEHLGAALHRVRIERGGHEFALVPGGPVTVGFDVDRWQPTADQAADYAESLEQGYGAGPDLKTHLARVLSPRRAAVLPTVLMAVEDQELPESLDELPRVFAEQGLRMPGADEWEHACGAGADTLFRWGDDCPLDDGTPYDCDTGPQRELNAFGLRIAYDTYRMELSSEASAVHGGDGGGAECGGYGLVLAWLPLATAHRMPELFDALYEPDDYEDFSVRPVLAL